MADKLAVLRRQAAKMRDLELEIADLEEQAAERKRQLEEMRHQVLPDLFMEAGVDALSLQAEGNQPAAEFTLKPFYRANIAASWPAERREAAFKHLESLGYGDVIKYQIKVDLPRGERVLASRVEKGLDKLGLTYASNLSVHAQTLTALLREQYESGNKKLDLDKIGGQAGLVVVLKS